MKEDNHKVIIIIKLLNVNKNQLINIQFNQLDKI